jgi:hypothetical protein
MRYAIVLAAVTLAARAQDIQIPAGLEKLADKAEHSVDVTMDKSMLQFASRFLSGNDADEVRTKKLLAGLDRVVVRSFEFDREGEYASADLDALRAQLQAPAWSRIVGIRSRDAGENADVFFKNGVNGQIGGIVIIAAEPRTLTIVSVSGTIDPGQIGDLGGHFGIPKLKYLAKGDK